MMFETQKSIIEKRLEAVERAKQKALNKLKLKQESEARRLNEEFVEQAKGVVEESHKDSASELYEYLMEDSAALKERSISLDIPEEALEKARRAQHTLDKIVDADEKERFNEMFDIVMPEEVKRAMKFGGRYFDRHEVYSFIDVDNNTGVVYLITPRAAGDNSLLSKALEEKIIHTIGDGEIITGSVQTESRGIITPVVKKARFGVTETPVNGFVVYSIKPENPATLHDIAVAVKEKLQQLQPKEFEKARLTHIVEEVDFPLTQYFSRYKAEDLTSPTRDLEKIEEKGQQYVTREEAAKLMQRSRVAIDTLVSRGRIAADDNGVSVQSMIDYLSTNPKRGKRAAMTTTSSAPKVREDYTVKRHEAYVRLAQCPNEKLNVDEVANILGVRTNHIQRLTIPSEINPSTNAREFNKIDVQQYMDSRELDGLGWRQKKDNASGEQRKQEAYARLQALGDALTTREVAIVLGITREGARKAGIPGTRIPGTNAISYSRESVRAYIDARTHDGRGWMLPNPEGR